MRPDRIEWDGREPGALAARLRASQPGLEEVTGDVEAIIAEVERDGDAGLAAVSERLGSPLPDPFRISSGEVSEAADALDETLMDALVTTAANVRAVADAQPATETEVRLAQGQSVSIREVPVAAAGIYAPGGSDGYPSSVIMGCVAAKAAGVPRVAVASPPGPDGSLGPATLAAAAIGGADEIYAMGGAQAIAALALGTESIEPVDVIAGPGNRWVTEAKRRLSGRVGIDGIAGPSELMVIAGDGADPSLVALDLCAQAEHGADGLLVAAAPQRALLDAIAGEAMAIAAREPSVADAQLWLVEAPDSVAAAALAQALAPEHLEILTDDAELISSGLTTPGCVFLGANGATAFGDYIAGSNHVLPTGGAGRFQGPLGPGAFRRRISMVQMNGSAPELAEPGATLARAEGFPVHGESMLARATKETPT